MQGNKVSNSIERFSNPSLIASDKLITFEEALDVVGSKHRYQIFCFIYFGLQWMIAKLILFYIFKSWVLMLPVYLFIAPKINCHDNQQCITSCPKSFSDDSCQKFICDLPSNDWNQYLYGDSLITHFDPPLVCDQKNKASLIQSVVYFGSLVGFFIFSFIADNYGRKIGLALGWASASLGGIILAYQQNLYMVGVGLFLLGFGVNPSITIHLSFVNEHCQGKFREYQNAGVQMFFGFGEMLLVGIAYAYPSYEILTKYVVLIPLLALNIPIYFTQESPKYMYTKDKIKAVKILNSIARINRRPQLHPSQIQNCKLNDFNSKRVFSIIDLLKQIRLYDKKQLRYKSLRTMFICGFFIFMTMQLVFYGLGFALDQIGLNFYINALVIATFETLSYCVCDLLIPKLPRRKTIFMGFFGSSMLCVLYVVLKKPDDCGDYCTVIILQLALAGIIRFSITTVWTFSYTHLSELFPTVVRSLALGLISSGGQIGSMTSPYVVNHSINLGLSPLIPLGIAGILGSLLVLPLRETFNHPLKDEIEEDNEQFRMSYAISQTVEVDNNDLTYN